PSTASVRSSTAARLYVGTMMLTSGIRNLTPASLSLATPLHATHGEGIHGCLGSMVGINNQPIRTLSPLSIRRIERGGAAGPGVRSHPNSSGRAAEIGSSELHHPAVRWVYPPSGGRLVAETIVRTVCPHDCPDQCSMLATVRDGRLLRVQ